MWQTMGVAALVDHGPWEAMAVEMQVESLAAGPATPEPRIQLIKPYQTQQFWNHSYHRFLGSDESHIISSDLDS